MKKWTPYLILIVFFLFFFTGTADAQCSQCKLMAEQYGDTVKDSVLDNTNGNNINSAILYIMAAPYLLLGVIAFSFRKQILRFFKKDISSH